MSIYSHSYTKALRRYDRDLFVERTKDGALCVFRKVKRFVPVCVDEGFKLLNLIEDRQLVFALTENWTMRGKPVDWGIDDVLGRVQSLDHWANVDLVERLDAENERIDQIRAKDMRNEMEAFWSDNRERVKKATGDILTHSLSKDNKRQILRDRSIKNGNR
jgi:hypothetical protein